MKTFKVVAAATPVPTTIRTTVATTQPPTTTPAPLPTTTQSPLSPLTIVAALSVVGLFSGILMKK